MTTPPPATLREHLQAAAALLLGGAFLVAGMPGLSTWGSGALRTEAARAEVLAELGPVVGALAIGAADFNRHVRAPVARRLIPAQRLFRVRQAWSLYGGGPPVVRHLEVWVDERLVYRTRDPQHAWEASRLGNRKVRPMVETAARKPVATNWKGLARYVLTRAREDFPAAQEVRILATRGAFGEEAAAVVHGRVARAPDWEVVEVGALGLPPKGGRPARAGRKGGAEDTGAAP